MGADATEGVVEVGVVVAIGIGLGGVFTRGLIFLTFKFIIQALPTEAEASVFQTNLPMP